MGNLTLNGSTSGSITIAPPAVAGSNTLTLPAATTTLVGQSTTDTLTNKTLSSPTISGTPVMSASVITSATAQNTTSGTSIDFTSIPSWVKRITISMNAIKSSGSANYIVQIGAGSVTTSGYLGYFTYLANTATSGNGSSTAGFPMQSGGTQDIHYGHMILTQLSTNLWVSSHCGGFYNGSTNFSFHGGGSITLGGTLDRVRLTTTNGTDTFAGGSVNIFYE